MRTTQKECKKCQKLPSESQTHLKNSEPTGEIEIVEGPSLQKKTVSSIYNDLTVYPLTRTAHHNYLPEDGISSTGEI